MAKMRHNRIRCPGRSHKYWFSHSPGAQAKLEILDHQLGKGCLPEDILPPVSGINGLKRESRQANASSRGFATPLDTLGAYIVHEIPLESTARMLQEWKRLLADALAAREVTFGDTLASMRADEWNSLFCLGYEVEEINVENELAEGVHTDPFM